jgi:hypothetical protein
MCSLGGSFPHLQNAPRQFIFSLNIKFHVFRFSCTTVLFLCHQHLCKQLYEIDMMRYLSFALVTLGSLALEHLPPIHYTISRRGGSFPAPDIANLTYLLEQLRVVEQRYNSTTRDFIGNKVVRKPKRPHGTQALSTLLGDVGRDGNWLASLHIGDPIQEVDMDLDMLTADWWIFSTSSGKGSFYLDFNSKTYGKTSLSFRCP